MLIGPPFSHQASPPIRCVLAVACCTLIVSQLVKHKPEYQILVRVGQVRVGWRAVACARPGPLPRVRALRAARAIAFAIVDCHVRRRRAPDAARGEHDGLDQRARPHAPRRHIPLGASMPGPALRSPASPASQPQPAADSFSLFASLFPRACETVNGALWQSISSSKFEQRNIAQRTGGILG